MSRLHGIVLALIAFAAFAPRTFADETAADKPPVKVAANETAIYVVDMHCAGCAKKVSSRLFKVKGVMKVRTDIKADVAVVTPQTKKQIDPKAAWAAVQAAGQVPVKLVGPQGTFVPDAKTKAPQKVAEAQPAAPAATR